MSTPVPSMHTVDSGRIFCRQTRDGACAFVGVLDIPRALPTERLLPVILASQLLIQQGAGRDPLQGDLSYMDPVELGTWDATNILGNMKFAAGALPNSIELFLRESFLDHHNPDRRWALAFGASPKRLSTTPLDGLYELSEEDGFQLVAGNPYNGLNIGQVLREHLWGPGGKFGLATSMTPAAYGPYVAKDRVRSSRNNPEFAKFHEALMAHGPELMTYTAEQTEARNRLALQILDGVRQEDETEVPSP